MRRIVLAAAAMATIATTPVAAQNVAANNGRWWNQAPPANSFVLLNPLTTLYARLGYFYSFGQDTAVTNQVRPPLTIAASHGLEIGIGFRLMPVLRYELRAGGNLRTGMRFAGAPGAFASASAFQLMNNLSFDIGPLIGNPFALNPYVFAGVGLSVNSIAEGSGIPPGNPIFDRSRLSFAWNAGVGVQWQPINHVILDLGYRYMDMGRFSETPANPSFFNFRDRREHQVTFGIIVPFDGLMRAFGN